MSLKLKTKGIGLVFLVLIIGVVMGWLAHTALAFPPSDHQAIADKIKVYDATFQRYQTLRFERSGEGRLMSTVKLFTLQDKTYKYSFWTFATENDVNAAMWIWGPDENGLYGVEVAKLAGNRIDVTWPDGSKSEDITYIGKAVSLA